MPRTSSASRGRCVCHFLKRHNGRNEVLHKDGDFAAFVNLMRTALEKVPIRVTGVSLNSKHFYLLLSPHKVGEMSRWMQRLLTFRRTLTVRSLSDGLLRDAPILKQAQRTRHFNGIAS